MHGETVKKKSRINFMLHVSAWSCHLLALYLHTLGLQWI